ncbi:glycosyl transferase family 1 [Niabella ginsenosidivorans]|uniref:Glycosyl transferase family 1 n=1 Tax=Niabella ginsenosidivorans TaxID=1176587 RepID=A0A1A9I3W8_9BACT|nr:glycosyltransferase [Niabella ginsenosidivorans]ANH81749.1 glycosyl transferase family 1 [Niabella ginsenosidivorans]
MAKVIIIGPAHPLRGGLATFDHRLAKAFQETGHECAIWSFALQYPAFLFPGKSQFTEEPAPEGITIHTRINSINPLNWIKTGNAIAKESPDIVVVRYWLPFMGPALGTILRRIRKNKKTRIICIADNITPHEKRPGDKPFTRYFIKACDGFITMSEKVMTDLRTLTGKPAQLVPHPLYDNFGPPVSMKDARAHLGLPPDDPIILFFGFIRKYKGLDLLLRAVSDLRSHPDPDSYQGNLKLLVAGEFYEDETAYQNLIDELGIREMVILRTNFIPDSEVRYYLCAANLLVQPYRNATQSGVTPLAYYFEKPMVVTNVGGLPSLVPHGKSGLIAAPDAAAIASAVAEFFKLGENHFIPHLRAGKEKYSWGNLVNAIMDLARKTIKDDTQK